MRKYLDGWDIAAHVRFIRQNHKGAIFLVEGDEDDKLMSSFVDENACSIEISFGKDNALNAIDLLEEDGVCGVIALVDSDFDRILSREYGSECVVATDLHDMDMTIIFSEAGRKYLREKSQKDRLTSIGEDRALELSLAAATVIAFYRLANERGLSLKFKNIDFKFVGDDLSVDEPLFQECLFENSPNMRCTKNELVRAVDSLRRNEYDLLQLCNGHDVAAIIGIALRKLLADRPVPQTWASEVSSDIRLAFDAVCFQRTKMFRAVRAWEAANAPFRVLKSIPERVSEAETQLGQ